MTGHSQPERSGTAFKMSVFERPIPRRALLIKAGVAGLGASLALAGSSTAPRRKDRATAGSVHLALLSDTHIPEDTNDSYRGFYPYQNLQQITRELISNRPDAVVITGDLARLSGQVGDYRNLERLLSPLARQRRDFSASLAARTLAADPRRGTALCPGLCRLGLAARL